MLKSLSSSTANGIQTVPRFESSDSIEWHNGKPWARNFPRVCPFCGVMFYGWSPQPWPATWPPDTLEPFPPQKLGMGHRHTCGQPGCLDDAWWEHALWSAKEYARMAEDKRLMEALARADAEQEQKEPGRRF